VISKHTQGKWKHEQHPTDYRGTGLIWAQEPDWEEGMYSSPNVKVVAKVQYADNSLRQWAGSSGEEFEANCRLIEMAPQLFKAAKLLEDLMTNHKGHFRVETKDLGSDLVASEMINLFRTAIEHVEVYTSVYKCIQKGTSDQMNLTELERSAKNCEGGVG
jgi:hypothetical protein